MDTTSMASSVQTAFADLERRLSEEPSRTAGLTAVYQFELGGEGGGVWHVEIIDGRAAVREGRHDHPDCIIHMTAADYMMLAHGELDGRTAFMTGRLRTDGDVSLAMRARDLFA